ncbi:MAG: hypothetical protein ACRDOK_12380 [Streptosporangiaceae bacterium]
MTSLLVGIGRAWEFIGERDTGILASLGILAGHAAIPETEGAPDGAWANAGGAASPAGDGRGESVQHDDETG